MVTPQVPGGRSVRQAVFDNQAHGQRDNPLRVAATRWGEIGQISTEVTLAARTMVSRVDHLQIAGAVVEQAADVVQDAPAEVIPVTAMTATGAGTPAEVT
jgi:hypothetical protein